MLEDIKNNIEIDINNYIEKIRKNCYKNINIKKEMQYIHKLRNRYQIQIRLFGKKRTLDTYDTIEEAKKSDCHVELFNKVNSENIDEHVDKIDVYFTNNIVKKIIYVI